MKSVRERARERLLSECIKPAFERSGKAMVLVLDEHTTRVVSSCCRTRDVLNSGVSLIESLGVARQPMPHMDAVYVISPTPESVKAVVQDFDSKNGPKYNLVHIFFTSHFPSDLLKELKTPALLRRVAALVQLNLDFVAWEEQVVHLDMPPTPALLLPSHPHRAALADQTVLGLVSLVITMREMPMVRYDRNSELAKDIALRVNQGINDTARNQPNWFQASAQSPTVVIVDRAFDAASPLIHERTYQALAYDTVESIADHTFSYEDNNQTHAAILDEQDQLWRELRHLPIEDCIQSVSEGYKEFAKKAKEARQNFEAMREALNRKREDDHKFEKYPVHMELVMKCSEAAQRLRDVMELEQGIAAGKARSESEYSRMARVVLNPDESAALRLRVLMLFIAARGLEQSAAMKLCGDANFSDDDTGAVRALYALGMNATQQQEGNQAKGWMQRMGALIPRDGDDGRQALYRFQPRLNHLLAEAIQGKLSESDFPFVSRPRAVSSNVQNDDEFSHWVKPTWQYATAKHEKDDRSRVIVFVVGGATLSEARLVYEVGKGSNHDLVLASNCILTPKIMVEALRGLAKDLP